MIYSKNHLFKIIFTTIFFLLKKISRTNFATIRSSFALRAMADKNS